MVYNPSKFKTAPQAIASYDYIDIEEGTGIIIFDASASKTNIETSYSLSKNAFFSSPKLTSAGKAASGTYVKIIDIDFDVFFNTGKTIGGNAMVSVPLQVYSSLPNNTTIYIVCKLRKYDGSTETDLDSVRCASFQAGVASVTHRFRETMPLEINNTYFVAGDILRLTIEVWETSSPAGGTATISVLHDPENSSTVIDDISTILQIKIPFKLEV